MGVLGDTFAEETGVADIVKFFCSEVVVSCSREIRGSDVYFQRQEVAFRVTDADVVRACTIGNRAVASRGSSRLSPRRKSKEPLSRRVAICQRGNKDQEFDNRRMCDDFIFCCDVNSSEFSGEQMQDTSETINSELEEMLDLSLSESELLDFTNTPYELLSRKMMMLARKLLATTKTTRSLNWNQNNANQNPIVPFILALRSQAARVLFCCYRL